jgi:serine protease Do
MQRQVFLSLSALSLCATVAGAQEGRGDVRIYGPLAGARAFSIERGPRAALGVSTSRSGGMRDTLGLLVSSVTTGGPAEKAGIVEGNRLQSINGVSLRAAREDAEDGLTSELLHRRLTRELGKVKPGDEVTLRVYAEGRARDVRVKTADSEELFETRVGALGERVRRTTAEMRARGDSLRREAENRPSLGVSIGSSGSKRDTLGVLVIGVSEGGPAEKAGLEEGNRIQSIDGVDLRIPPEDVDEGILAGTRARRLSRALQNKKAGDEVELRVYGGGQTRTVRVKTVRSGDLPGRRSMTYIIGDGLTTSPARVVAPRAPFRFDFDDFDFDDLDLRVDTERLRRDLDDVRIELDGARIGEELSRIGPMVRDQLDMIGPEIRWNMDRAMRDLELNLGRGADGLGAGLEGLGRALEDMRFHFDFDVDATPRTRRGRRADAAPAPTPAAVAARKMTSF